MENGTLQRAIEALARLSPTVGIIDSTFIESAYGGPGNAPSGYKRACGVNLHVTIDKTSRVLANCILPANKQEAEGARRMLSQLAQNFPTVLGDKAYHQAPLQQFAKAFGIEIDGRSPPLRDGAIFKPMPPRWRVEQLFSWLAKWCRPAKNWCYSADGFARDVAWSIFSLMLGRSIRGL